MEPVPSPFSTSPPIIYDYKHNDNLYAAFRNFFLYSQAHRSVTLYHELLYHAMKFGPCILFSSYAAGSKSDKVFHRFRRDIAEQANNNSSNWMIVNHDVEVHLIGDLECFCLKRN